MEFLLLHLNGRVIKAAAEAPDGVQHLGWTSESPSSVACFHHAPWF